jgi:hypothetical protein
VSRIIHQGTSSLSVNLSAGFWSSLGFSHFESLNAKQVGSRGLAQVERGFLKKVLGLKEFVGERRIATLSGCDNIILSDHQIT